MVASSDQVESGTYSAPGLIEYGGEKYSSTPPGILSILSSVVERLIQKNEYFSKAWRKNDVVTIFHGSRAPNFSIRQYLERIFKYSNCSPYCFVVAYIYLDRFLHQTNGGLTSLNVHRLLITCILVAAKFIGDECCNNAYYAKIGGISTAEMNKLEMNFLFTLQFKLHVTTEVFQKYCLELEMEGVANEYRINPIPIVEAFGSKAVRPDRDDNGNLAAGHGCRV